MFLYIYIYIYINSHIMSLDVGFHLDRNIGKLSRIVDRGTRSVAMVFRALLFTFIPTIIELVLVCYLLWRSFSPICCGMILLTFLCYTMFTMKMSTAAAVIRKKVNKKRNAHLLTNHINIFLCILIHKY